jgi:hypothetical protein
VLSALLSAGANSLLAAKQYKRDYHREIILRRLNAYEIVHGVIGMLRGASYDNSGRTAHLVFAGGPEFFHQIQVAISTAISHSIWLDPDVRDHLVSLNRLLLPIPFAGSQEEIFAAGSAIYEDVGRLREDLEGAALRSMEDLHQVELFLRLKKKQAASGREPRVQRLPKFRES